MFIGHYSAAFLTKRAAPALPLPVCFLACQLIDLCWGALVLLGVEKLRVIPHFTASNGLDLYFMPFTHSLPAAVLWSVDAAALFLLLAPTAFPQRRRAAFALGLAVGSHWLLDWVVHVPDLPVWPGVAHVGLGLWNYRYPALLLELALLWGALLIALPAVGARRGRYLLLGAVMSVVQPLSLVLQPAQPAQVAAQLMATYLALTIGAYWAERRPADAASAIAA